MTDKEFKKLIKRMEHFMIHSWMCALRGIEKGKTCDCGLDELREEMDKVLKTKKKKKKKEKKT